jgi:hypothetical protein
MAPPVRFPIRFDDWYRPLSWAVLMPPGDAYLEVGESDVHARMSWAFRATFARSAVESATRWARAPISRGVHGFAGRWLVNGAGDRILSIKLEPRQRARVVGVPVALRELLVSVDDPAALAQAITG